MLTIKTTHGEYKAKHVHKDNGCIFFFDDNGNEIVIQYEDIISIN